MKRQRSRRPIGALILLLSAGFLVGTGIARAHVCDHWPIEYLIGGGDYEGVKHCLDEGYNVNQSGSYVPIVIAAEGGHARIVELLINNGADVDRVQNSATALMVAAARGDTKIAALLLEAGAAIDKQDGRGRTALFEASLNGQTAVVKQLIAAGADVNLSAKDGGGNDTPTPLMVASASGHEQVVEVLALAGANIDATNLRCATGLFWAAYDGKKDAVATLLTHGAVSNIIGSTFAAWSGTPEMAAEKEVFVEIARMIRERGKEVKVSPVPGCKVAEPTKNLVTLHFIKEDFREEITGKPVAYEVPFFVEARFAFEPDYSKRIVQLHWDDQPHKKVMVFKTGEDPTTFRSGALTLQSLSPGP